jgi:tetratricopeptide (TPR) repeat protein
MDKAEQVYKRTSSLPEKRYRPVYAMFLMQTGRIPAGLAELERLAGETPGDREIRNLLLSAYLSQNKVEEAQNLLAATLKKNPKDADALMQRGRLHLSAGKLAEAEHDLTQALRFKNDSAIAHFLMAAVHKGRGAAQNQKQSLTQALRLTPGFLAARIELARAHMAARNPAAALDVLDEAPESQRLAAAAVVERNWALIALRRQNEARKNVAAALAAAKTAGLLFQDAVLKFDDRNYRASRAAVEELLKTDPENVRAVDLLVRTYFAERQPNAGLARLRELAERSQRPPLNMLLGQWLLATGKSSEARGVFSAVKAANPKSVAPDLALAQADLAERRFDSGRRTLQTVVSAEPGNVVARLLLARIEEQTGNNSAAVEQYRKIVETQPGNTPALNNLAFHLAAHSPDEALRYAQRAKDLAPEDPAVENTLGWTLYQKGLYSTAVRHLESAAAKQPTARRNAHLAMAYLKSGNRSRGQQALEAAVKLDPDLPEVKAAQDMVAADHRR